MKRADEMETYINLRSTRLAWAYSLVFLVIWMWYEHLKGHHWEMPLILISSQLIIFWASQLFLKRRMAGKDEKQD